MSDRKLLIEELVIDTREKLTQIKSDVDSLLNESQAESAFLGRIARSFHEIKGVAGFLNLPRLQTVARSITIPLPDGSNRHMFLKKRFVDSILEGVASLDEIINTLDKTGEEI